MEEEEEGMLPSFASSVSQCFPLARSGGSGVAVAGWNVWVWLAGGGCG